MADPAYIANGTLLDGEAWVALFSTTLTSDTASITFTSTDDGQVGDFSQYMDLVAILYWRAAVSQATRMGELDINGDTTDANYDIQGLSGDGSAADAWVNAENRLALIVIGNSSTANAFSTSIVTFSDINSGKYKTYYAQNAGDYSGAGQSEILVGVYKSQAPITSILFKVDYGDMLDESRIDLFGVLPRMVTV
jgi:glutathionyl-hydroquinone reductase